MDNRGCIWGVAALVALLLLSSCAQVNDTPVQSGSALPTADIPSHVSRTVSEQVTIDADVAVPTELETLSVNVYSAQRMVFGEKRAYRVFFGDEPFASRIEHPQRKNGLHSTAYTAENGSILLAGANNCSFQTPLSQYMMNVFVDNIVDPHYNLPRYAAQPELAFETEASALASVKEILSSLGATVCGQYQCYAMPHDVMREESLTLKQALPIAAGDFKTDWTQDEECYLFQLHAYAEPLPILREVHGLLDDGTLVMGSTVDVIYSVNGVEFLYINSVYQPTGVVQENVCLISFDDALARAMALINSVIITGELKVEQIRLQYIPMPADKTGLQYTLVPAWSFQAANMIDLDDGVSVTTRCYIHINAVTGEEIV